MNTSDPSNPDLSTMSLRNLGDFTPEQIIEESLRRLVAQGQTSVSGGGCRYRATTADGKKLACAVGLLMDDADYSSSYEGCGVYTLMERMPDEIRDKVDDDRLNVLKDLQMFHDGARSVTPEQSLAHLDSTAQHDSGQKWSCDCHRGTIAKTWIRLREEAAAM